MQSSHDEILIDPTNPESAMLMETFINFSLKKGEVLLQRNKPYQILLPNQSSPTTIKLKNDILLRVKEKLGQDGEYHLEPHCYVLGPIEKKGGLQNEGVPDILGVLQLDKTMQKKGLIYISDESKKKSRLVKIKKHQFSSEFLEKNEMKNLGALKKIIERRLSILQAYIPFHAKSFIGKEIDQLGDIESYTKMRKFKGKLLSEVLKENLSTQTRIQLSIALLDELKVLHNLGIAHYDIKPENIIVHIDIKSGKVLVRFIDFDTAQSKNFQGETGFVTKPYASPELIVDSRHSKEIEAHKRERSVDKRSDIWQMGLALAEVWQGKQRDKNWAISLDDKTLLTDKSEPDLLDELDIFYNIKNITVKDAKFNDEIKLLYETLGIQSENVDFDFILSTIKNMLRADKNKRIDVDQAIDNFENIRFNYLYPLTRLNILDRNKISILENEKRELEQGINKINLSMSNSKLNQGMKDELNEILKLKIDRLREINSTLKLNSTHALISALRSVNYFVKKFRHNNDFHISLSPKEIMNLKIKGFDFALNSIYLMIKDENEKDKEILFRELKDVLDLNSFNGCNKLEDIQETSKNILQQLLDLKYQHLNLLFKVKMTFQLLEMMADPAKNQIIKLPFSTEKKSEYINPLITMNTLLKKIDDLYRGRVYHHLNNLDDINEFNEEFDRKLNALEHSFDDLNHRCQNLLKAKDAKESKEEKNSNIILTSDTGFNYFKRYENVLNTLNLVNPVTTMDDLKNAIKIAIFEYMDETIKTKLIPPNRLADLEGIGKILTTDDIVNPKLLIETMQTYLNKIERRFVTATPIQTKIENAMEKFTRAPINPHASFTSSASSVKK